MHLGALINKAALQTRLIWLVEVGFRVDQFHLATPEDIKRFRY